MTIKADIALFNVSALVKAPVSCRGLKGQLDYGLLGLDIIVPSKA